MSEWEQVVFSPHKGNPKITLRKNSQVGFNSTFVTKYDLEKFDGAELFVSKDRKQVAIKFIATVVDSNKQAKLIKHPKNFFFAASILKALYDIDGKKCEFSEPKYDPEADLHVVDVISIKESEKK